MFPLASRPLPVRKISALFFGRIVYMDRILWERSQCVYEAKNPPPTLKVNIWPFARSRLPMEVYPQRIQKYLSSLVNKLLLLRQLGTNETNEVAFVQFVDQRAGMKQGKDVPTKKDVINLNTRPYLPMLS